MPRDRAETYKKPLHYGMSTGSWNDSSRYIGLYLPIGAICAFLMSETIP